MIIKIDDIPAIVIKKFEKGFAEGILYKVFHNNEIIFLQRYKDGTFCTFDPVGQQYLYELEIINEL